MESQEQIRQAKAAQEQAMVENAYQTIAAYGGPIHKYFDGGLDSDNPTSEEESFYNPYKEARENPNFKFQNPMFNNPGNNFKFNTGMPKNAFGKGIAAYKRPAPMTPMPSKPMSSIAVPPNEMPGISAKVKETPFNEQPGQYNNSNNIDEGIRENSMAPYLGYGMQALGLGAEAWRLRGKNTPNKAFTMNRQVLNADEALNDADMQAANARNAMRNLGASTSSGGAMQGYLASQALNTRGKSNILSNLRKEQATSDMAVDQYNAMAGERAYDKNAADKAAQQSAYSKWFGNVGQFGANIAKDYGARQSENIAAAALGTADFDYKRIKGKLVKVHKGTV